MLIVTDAMSSCNSYLNVCKQGTNECNQAEGFLTRDGPSAEITAASLAASPPQKQAYPARLPGRLFVSGLFYNNILRNNPYMTVASELGVQR